MLPCDCQAKEGQRLVSGYSDLCLALVFGLFFFLSVFAGKNVAASVWWEIGLFPPGAGESCLRLP